MPLVGYAHAYILHTGGGTTDRYHDISANTKFYFYYVSIDYAQFMKATGNNACVATNPASSPGRKGDVI